VTAITADGLRVTYGSVVAVDSISFRVEEGEVFGLVGPNGAGKTSTIECLEGLRKGAGGEVRVLGLDPSQARRELQERIGCQLQESNLPDRLRVSEALDLFASFYPHRADREWLLGALGLAEKRNAYYRELSGGQKQRLFIALALVGDPELVFMDELTTGLDPHARRELWKLVSEIRAEGKTMVLSTHYMDEVEKLCDRVAILDQGRIVALDKPARLISELGAAEQIVITIEGEPDAALLSALDDFTSVDVSGDTVRLRGKSEGLAARAVAALSGAGVRVRDVHTERGTLEDVFLALTGRHARSPGQGAAD
jgi:ABC-2 type transport system ATP-binding protein